ncbi:MAG: DNA cytosine methyltransferase [Tissierella sp.]|nr:DNA cytosine methyltransferase [Tissierella sp.]
MIKHLSLFSGIESFKKALTNLGIANELVGFSEFDKYATVALTAIHGVSEELNYGDITKIDETKLPNCDLITYGFPCQDISVAGLGKGIIEGETRSGLLFDALRIIKYKKPKYAIAENVKNLVGKRFKEDFESLLGELESYGYNNYWKVLNAKDYGIPQNRERVFIVSIRKDVDDGKFEFPKRFDNGIRLRDFLENEVEEKYYIENEKVEKLINSINLSDRGVEKTPNEIQMIEVEQLVRVRKHEVDIEGLIFCLREHKEKSKLTNRQISESLNKPITLVEHWFRRDSSFAIPDEDTWYKLKELLKIEINEFDSPITEFEEKQGVYEKGNRYYHEKGIAPTLTTSANERIIEQTPNELKLFINLKGGKWDKIHESARRVHDEEGLSLTMPTCGGGNIEPKVAVREATKKGYAVATVGDSINIAFPNSATRRGRRGEGVAQTLETGCNQATLESNYRIRKLTPLECWRLMGFTDEDYWKARTALEERFYNGKDKSNSQMYKMAGNSIVVNVLEGILKNLIK